MKYGFLIGSILVKCTLFRYDNEDCQNKITKKKILHLFSNIFDNPKC